MCSSGRDEIVTAIEERIAQWTTLPRYEELCGYILNDQYSVSMMFRTSTHLCRSHGEPIEVLRYTNGQKYEAHCEYHAELQCLYAWGSQA